MNLQAGTKKIPTENSGCSVGGFPAIGGLAFEVFCQLHPARVTGPSGGCAVPHQVFHIETRPTFYQ